jgi:imidazolonepropionase-like amidohydrolase
VVPVSSPPISGGTVLLADGMITAVGGSDLEVPTGATVVEATGKWVLPGFVESHAHVGIHEESNGVPGDDTNETSNPNMAGVRALDGIDIEDEGFRDAVSAGITTVVVKPGSGNPIGGQTVAIKTWGGLTIDDQLVNDSVSIKSAFGENPKLVYSANNMTPMTRLGIAVVIRQAFEEARFYVAQRDAAKDGPFRRDLALEALGRLLSGELAWDVHVHRHDDIASAMRVAEEFGLRLVVNHGTEAHKIAGLLAERDIPVIVGPIITARSKLELSDHSVGTAGVLASAGVRIAITTDHPEVPIYLLPVQAALAVRDGLDKDAALEALTTSPAHILRLDTKVGSLAEGLDGDVVIWSGDPLDVKSRAERVFIRGVQVYEWDAAAGEGRMLERH